MGYVATQHPDKEKVLVHEAWAVILGETLYSVHFTKEQANLALTQHPNKEQLENMMEKYAHSEKFEIISLTGFTIKSN